jgi:hypothetical protein
LLEKLSEDAVVAADDVAEFNFGKAAGASTQKADNLPDESAQGNAVRKKEKTCFDSDAAGVHLSGRPMDGRRSKKESTTAVTERENRITGALLPLIALQFAVRNAYSGVGTS